MMSDIDDNTGQRPFGSALFRHVAVHAVVVQEGVFGRFW